MAKGKSTWKHNKLLTARRNYFDLGGPTAFSTDTYNQVSTGLHNILNDPNFKSTLGGKTPLPTSGGGGTAPGMLGAIGAVGMQAASDIAGMINNIQSNDITDRADQLISATNSLQMKPQSSSDTFDALASDWLNNSAIQHVTAKQIGAKSFGQGFGEAFVAGNQGFNAGAGLGFIGAAASAVGSTLTSIVGNISRNRRAKEEAKRINSVIDYTNNFNERSLVNRGDNLSNSQMQGLLSNYAAFGGELNTQGGDFTNGLLYIDNGGSHESNPYEGVPLGVDPEGTPNLVEEGETVFNDYVFSKRLKVPKAIRDKYKLRSTKDMTFAEMSKQMAKESEERPNDPISMRGLEAMMNDLANAQEGVRESKQSKQYAKGGRLFKEGGLKYWKKKRDIETNLPWLKSLYTNGTDTSAWDALFDKDENIIATKGGNTGLYDPNGAYMQALNRIFNPDEFNNWSPEFSQSFVNRLKSINPTRYSELTVDNMSTMLSREQLYNLATDGMVGGHHQVGELASQIKPKDKTSDSSNTAKVAEQEPAKESKTPINKYFEWVDGKYIPVEGDDPLTAVLNKGLYQAHAGDNDTGGKNYYYNPKKEEIPIENYPTWMRYAPAVGFGIGALSDTLGLTNKPDYSNADAILEASRGAGTYQPVRFKPIGNYLTYRPFDRDYYINKMNAEAGATRRAITNTSGGNRATAMAGILAADNNYLGQIGDLARQAEEYNLSQRNQVEEFNRGTNTTNSQGFLQADMANQKTLMNSREFSLKGTMAAAEMRERARLASDQTKAANISGLFTTIGDIGRENFSRNQVSWLRSKLGIPGTSDYVLSAKGGKIRRKKKGLTY